MVYISGEEMTNYCMNLILDNWVRPRMDISSWEFYDLSCINRDNTDDEVLRNAVDAGKRVKSIFKEPTITPTEVQKKKMGLKAARGSPNGAMRKGWNGYTISRDTIHIDGLQLGFKHPVLFDRHAVGGEYSAGYKYVGSGEVKTVFRPKDGGESVLIDRRKLSGDFNAVVTYDNPLDNVVDLAHHFFSRCLKARITPYVVTKKTVFKWQEGFWTQMKGVFDEHYKEKFVESGLLQPTGGQLAHLISDAATMQLIRWTEGGFGMACHNYDGDMLTDEVAQLHRSPGFITSNLIGKSDDGTPIKEFEASHGTVTDMWEAHLRGEETSINPLGMVEALIGAMRHSADLSGQKDGDIYAFTEKLRTIIHKLMVSGKGTRDISGPTGVTTEEFVQSVAKYLDTKEPLDSIPELKSQGKPLVLDNEKVKSFYERLDVDKDGKIDFDEFVEALVLLNIQPKTLEAAHKA